MNASQSTICEQAWSTAKVKIAEILNLYCKMASEGTAVQPERTFFDVIWDSIITPGAGPGLIATINGSLLVLMGTVVWYTMAKEFNIHLMVILFLALGLLLSLNW